MDTNVMVPVLVFALMAIAMAITLFVWGTAKAVPWMRMYSRRQISPRFYYKGVLPLFIQTGSSLILLAFAVGFIDVYGAPDGRTHSAPPALLVISIAAVGLVMLVMGIFAHRSTEREVQSGVRRHIDALMEKVNAKS